MNSYFFGVDSPCPDDPFADGLVIVIAKSMKAARFMAQERIDKLNAARARREKKMIAAIAANTAKKRQQAVAAEIEAVRAKLKPLVLRNDDNQYVERFYGEGVVFSFPGFDYYKPKKRNRKKQT